MIYKNPDTYMDDIVLELTEFEPLTEFELKELQDEFWELAESEAA